MITTMATNSIIVETRSFSTKQDIKINGEDFEDTTIEISESFSDMVTIYDQDQGYYIDKVFKTLAQEWERERPRGADIQEMVMHPAYQRIIGMGSSVVSLLLQELEQKPEHWFFALWAITGADPVPLEKRGNIHEMAKAWISWGKRNGYIG